MLPQYFTPDHTSTLSEEQNGVSSLLPSSRQPSTARHTPLFESTSEMFVEENRESIEVVRRLWLSNYSMKLIEFALFIRLYVGKDQSSG